MDKARSRAMVLPPHEVEIFDDGSVLLTARSKISTVIVDLPYEFMCRLYEGFIQLESPSKKKVSVVRINKDIPKDIPKESIALNKVSNAVVYCNEGNLDSVKAVDETSVSKPIAGAVNTSKSKPLRAESKVVQIDGDWRARVSEGDAIEVYYFYKTRAKAREAHIAHKVGDFGRLR